MCPKLRDWEGERVPKIDEIWMLACINNSTQNGWFWRQKFKKIVKKKRFQKPSIVRMRFCNDFGEVWAGFWKGFGRGFGGPWRLLGDF